MDTPMDAGMITKECTYLCDDGSACPETATCVIHAVCTGCGAPSDDHICGTDKDLLARGKIRCSYCACPMASLDAVSLN